MTTTSTTSRSSPRTGCSSPAGSDRTSVNCTASPRVAPTPPATRCSPTATPEHRRTSGPSTPAPASPSPKARTASPWPTWPTPSSSGSVPSTTARPQSTSSTSTGSWPELSSSRVEVVAGKGTTETNPSSDTDLRFHVEKADIWDIDLATPPRAGDVDRFGLVAPSVGDRAGGPAGDGRAGGPLDVHRPPGGPTGPRRASPAARPPGADVGRRPGPGLDRDHDHDDARGGTPIDRPHHHARPLDRSRRRPEPAWPGPP